jgi:hypothetical protein
MGRARANKVQKASCLFQAKIVEVGFDTKYGMPELPIVADLPATDESVRGFMNDHTANTVYCSIQIVPR